MFTIDIKFLPAWSTLLKSQVFTPCLRYGISLPANYQAYTDATHWLENYYDRLQTLPPDYDHYKWESSTLPVMDYYNKILLKYRYEGKAEVQCDIIYCLTSTLMVSIKSGARTFKQQIWQLNHEEQTYRLVSTRNFRHKVRLNDLAIHKNCRYDLTLDIDGEKFNIWISDAAVSEHHLLFLIPRNPQSSAKMKLFYINLKELPAYAIFALRDLYIHAFPYMAPSIHENNLSFPVGVEDNPLRGACMTLFTENLRNVIDSEEVNIELLKQQQESAYRMSYCNDSLLYGFKQYYIPDYTNTYSSQNCFIMWDRKKNPIGCHKGVLSFPNGMVTEISLKGPGAFDIFTFHPLGCVIIWNVWSNQLTAKIRNSSNRKVPSLFEMCKKLVLLSNDFKEVTKNLKYQNILFL